MWLRFRLHSPHGAGSLPVVCRVMLSPALQVNEAPYLGESRYCFVLWGLMELEHLLGVPLSFLSQTCYSVWVPSGPLILSISRQGLERTGISPLQFLPAFKDQVFNIFGFWGCIISVATTWVYFVGEAAVDHAYLWGHGCIPGKLFTTTGPASSLLPLD